MTEIFRCLAGSRLYGTHTANSDHDFKAVHLPTKRGILLGKRELVHNHSSGGTEHNGADDVDVESFELQRFLKLASDMQTIPVEMLFFDPRGETRYFHGHPIWAEVVKNRGKILNRNTKAFVGYCKGQAVRYSMRGSRLQTFERVVEFFAHENGMVRDKVRLAELASAGTFDDMPGVTFPVKQHGEKQVTYMDVYGRQVPDNVTNLQAKKVFLKPVSEAGQRAKSARDAGGMDNKALYHAVRIADEGISLFRDGNIEFPCQNLPLLAKIRAGEVEIDEILDIFDEKIAILEGIGENSPLAAAPDREWIDDFVAGVYEDIVRA